MTQINEHGPAIGEEEITGLERRIRTELPADYRNFLLRYNGGKAAPDGIAVPGFAESPTDVAIFFGIGRHVTTSNIDWQLDNLLEEFPDAKLLPFARDSFGGLFCLSLYQETQFKVVFFDIGSPGTLFPVADCFSDFVDKLSAH